MLLQFDKLGLGGLVHSSIGIGFRIRILSVGTCSSTVGSGRRLKDGKRVPLEVKVGDRILFGKYAGTEVKINDKEHVIIKEDEVLGIIT